MQLRRQIRKANKGFNLDWWAFARLRVFVLLWFSDSFTVRKRKMAGRITSKLTPTLAPKIKGKMKRIITLFGCLCLLNCSKQNSFNDLDNYNNLSKVFEPLFTTKSKGIGLGLAITKRMVEQNGGGIEVESTVGKGTTFTLILPLVNKEVLENETAGLHPCRG